MTTHITPGELAKVLGTNHTRVHRLTVGFIGKASIRDIGGTGNNRIFSYEDGLLIYIGAQLHDIGLNHSCIREICEWLKERLEYGGDFWPNGRGPICLWFHIADLKDDFNRKLREVRDGTPK